MSAEQRLIELRKELRLSQAKFADRIGLDRSAIANVERGQVKVSLQLASKIFSEFHTNPEWFLSGEGRMFLPSEEEKKAAARPSLDALVATKEELEELREADRAEKKELKKIADELGCINQSLQRELKELREIVRSQHYDSFPQPEEQPTIPYIRDLAAGPLREVLPDGDYTVPKGMHHLLRGQLEQYFASRVNGTSMIEIIPDGSIVLMRECFAPRSGRVYLFRVDSEFTLKEFGYDAEKEMPFLSYCDGSDRRIYPRQDQTCYCVAEFVAILEKGDKI